MFEGLSDKLERSFKVLKGHGHISEVNVAETLKEVRRALLDADVSFKIAKQFTETVKEKALGQKILTSVSPGQLMVKIVHDELAQLMGPESAEVNLKGSPSIILIAGLQGSGKTTFSAKLANFLKSKKGRNPILVAGDVYRPAAIEQLQTVAEQVGASFFPSSVIDEPVNIGKSAIAAAKKGFYDVLIVDTAGRLAVDDSMMKEIQSMQQGLNPIETLFVVDAMTGQDAANTAKAF